MGSGIGQHTHTHTHTQKKPTYLQSGCDIPKSERLVTRSGNEQSWFGGKPGDVEDGVVVGVEFLDAGFGGGFGRVEDANLAILVGDGEMCVRL